MCWIQGGLPDSSVTRDFADSLYNRIPRSSTQNGTTLYSQQERAKAALAVRNRRYALLDASDEEEDEAAITAVAPTTSALPPEAKKKSLRKAKVLAVKACLAF